jgi:hypothetical protein
MPCAFISATASPLALLRWAASTCRGASSVASTTLRTSSAYVGDSRSSSSSAATANGDSGWSSAKSGCSSTVSRTVRPSASGTASRSTVPARSSALKMRIAWRTSRRCSTFAASFSVSSRRMCTKKSPGRCTTCSSIAWLTRKLEVSTSGSAATSRSKVGLPQDTKPSGPSCARPA